MVKIICDSACDLSPDLLSKFQISVLPYHVLLAEEEYLDGVNITPDTIFSFVKENGILPKTSAPSLPEITDLFNRELEAYDEIVCFSISQVLSGAHSMMLLAAEDTGKKERIHIVDTKSLSNGIALLVMEASEMAAKGCTAKEIVERMEVLKPQVRVSFVVDTLKYLYMGGRCSAVEAFAGSTLRIHPLLSMEEGALYVKKKYHGSTDRCLLKYEEEIREELSKAYRGRVFLTASMDRKTPVLEEMYKNLSGCESVKELYFQNAGSVISSHCGPGASGILYIEKL